MDDLKELLPLAARAMGLEIDSDGTPFNRVIDDEFGPCCDDWNPLHPGDGAEMEDKLRISVSRGTYGLCSITAWPSGSKRLFKHDERYADHPDEGTARRWASLRVAAAIGRSMK